MIRNLFDFVEIRTKVTTSCSFLLALAYLIWMRRDIDWKVTLVFFFSMMLIDLSTTAINNYMDTKDSGKPLQFTRTAARRIILSMAAVSIAGGILLVCLTDLVVLLLGGFCFLCGFLYTWGPVPISRTPLGEAISGIVQGGIGPFILLYINSPQRSYLHLDVVSGHLIVEFSIASLMAAFLLTVPSMCTIAAIMLANNICDRAADIKVHRYTLAFYLTEKQALYLFAGLYYVSYGASVLMVIFKMASPILLLSVLTILPVQRNIRQFFKKQEKSETFSVSISNFVMIVGADIVLFLLNTFINVEL